MGYKQNRRFMLTVFIILVMNVIGLFNTSVNGSSATAYVYSNLITATPKSVVVGGQTKDVSSSYYFATGSGGLIKIDTRPAWVNEPQLIYDRDPTEGTDADGTKYKIYHAVIPFEYDITIYSSFRYQDGAGLTPTYSTSNGEDSIVCIGRGYKGDALSSIWGSQVNGYRSVGTRAGVDCQLAMDDINSIEVTGASWKTYGTQKISDYGCKNFLWSADTTIEHGDDGENLFRTMEATKQWYGHVPYLKLGVAGLGEESIQTVNYNAQKDHITKYADSANVDVGAFNVNWQVSLAPPLGVTPSFDIKKDGSVVYKLDGTWVSMKEAIDMGDSFHRKGLIAPTTVGSTENFLLSQNFGDTIKDDAMLLDKNDDKQGTGMAVFSSDATPITSQISPSEKTQEITGYSLGSPVLYSLDLNKKLSDFKSNDYKGLANYTQWEAQMYGFRCKPSVQVYKKTTLISYREQWYDTYGLGQGLWKNKDKPYTDIVSLAGWQVYNVFIHQRVQLTVDVYSKYKISVSQSEDREKYSYADDPEEDIGNRVWDNSNYNIEKYRETVGGSTFDLGDWFNNLGQYQWIVILIIGLLGVVVVVVGYQYIKRAIPSTSRGSSFQQFQQQQFQQQSFAQAQQSQSQMEQAKLMQQQSLQQLQEENQRLKSQLGDYQKTILNMKK